uniref:Uncharacterized protein n=1 Tax=Oryza sativa subsp. japonica TaxID=39947 RepID=Q6YS21_ORYSJ|nr:hypothetical protein [Oryza sativa Japonica Group]
MPPAHRTYLQYSHHLHGDRTPHHSTPTEDAPDLDLGARFSHPPCTTVANRRQGRCRAMEAAGAARSFHRRTPRHRRIREQRHRLHRPRRPHPPCRHRLPPLGAARPKPLPNAASSLDSRSSTTTVAIPTAIALPSANAVPIPTRSSRSGADLPVFAAAFLGDSLGHPSARERGAPPPPSLWPHGFAGGHSSGGEAEEGGEAKHHRPRYGGQRRRRLEIPATTGSPREDHCQDPNNQLVGPMFADMEERETRKGETKTPLQLTAA